jgi:hypothetical protein
VFKGGGTVAVGVLLPAVSLASEFADIQRSAYFNVDDFDNVYWTYHLSPGEMLGFVLDPTFGFFRPMGMLWYWLLGRAFNLDPAAFHAFLTALNLLNVGLVCLLALTLLRSRTAAVLTPLLWITSVALVEALWWFGSVFYVFATTCFVLALLAFVKIESWIAKSIVVLVAYLLAIKSQEAAVTLPAVLLAYEILVLGKLRTDAKPRIALYALLFAVAAVFTYLKVQRMSGDEASTGYAYSFTFETLQQNATWYAAQLFPWVPVGAPGLALGVLAVITVAAAALRDRRMLFGLAFAAITLLPVIFLVDHLFAFYWYLSGIGVWICVGQLGARMSALAIRRFEDLWRGVAWLAPVALLALVLALIEVQAREYRAPRVEWARAYAASFRAYVDSIVAQPDPAPGAVMDVRDAPSAFDSTGLTTLYRVLYDRTDIIVRVVDRQGASATTSTEAH